MNTCCTHNVPLPKEIVLRLPFAEAATLTELRATAEKETDFKDPAAAKLCTLSFAAAEIRKYLLKIADVTVSYAEAGDTPAGFIVDIDCGEAEKADTGYRLTPTEGGITLYGNGRVGALYAAYTLLKLQGIRWYYPEDDGEILPPEIHTLCLPESEACYAPDMRDGRGLDLFAPLKDSAKFLLWMARNRMNITADHVYTAALGDKLGMTFRIGGHMFEPFLMPDKPLADGRTIWEAHPEWYGLPPDGIRRKHRVMCDQFCVSRPDLVDYLAGILIGKLRGEWRHVDRVDIWGFDNGGGHSCHCEDCKRLGNDTDRAIFFLSELRRRLDREPDVSGVVLVGCAYEGTKTMAAPSRPIPENLKARDCIVCYPIHRCYAHTFDDPACPTNGEYMKTISPWLTAEDHLPMIIGEYYNVSRYEDLPLVFAGSMAHDIPLYKQMGFTSITYMHPPLYNWGVRALNHLLLAELSWDAGADATALCEEYFTLLYGSHKDAVQKAYADIERATEHIGSYRNWWYSLLAVLWVWDGGKPKKELDLTGHFADTDALITRMESDLACRRRALALIEEAMRAAKYEGAANRSVTEAMTPEQAEAVRRGDKVQSRLMELRRSFIWGADELALFTDVVKEYVGAERGEHDPARWERIEATYDKLSGYFFPHRYISREAEAFCEDALTRSQLRAIVDRRRAYKLEVGEITAP